MTTPHLSLSPPSQTPLEQASSSYVPYVRRRNNPAQLDALHQLFETTPHPTRAQRQALADEYGMEFKSVTNWFQNRRQTKRRKSLSWNENKPPKTRLTHSSQRHRHGGASKRPADRSVISLDHIAALSERPSPSSQSASFRIPLTPRKSNVERGKDNSPCPSDLWTYMLSSPIVPPSSPGLEEARLAVLPSRAKTFRSLEWACLKARQKKRADEDTDELPTLPALESCGEDEDDGTETEVDEAITPESSVNLSPHSVTSTASFNAKHDHDPFSLPKATPHFEDMDAAITLLGFKTRSQ